eukprot:1994959-Karenia_brevis.AAC.1
MSKMQLPRNGWGAYSQRISGRYLALTLATTGLFPSMPFLQGRLGWHQRLEVLFVLVEGAGWTSSPLILREHLKRSILTPTSPRRWPGSKLPPRGSLAEKLGISELQVSQCFEEKAAANIRPGVDTSMWCK